MPEPQADLVLSGARVIDPETGLDGVRDVAIRDGVITAVSAEPLTGARVLDVSGKVLTPGFIDLHSHAQTVTGLRLQALDGVTTALDLESGVLNFAKVTQRTAEEGRPINFGFSASWALARMHLLAGAPLDDITPETAIRYMADPAWRRPASAAEVGRIAGLLEEQVGEGALGIGILLGYAPESGRAEYVELAALAQRLDVPTYTHTRYISKEEPHTSLEGASEVIAAAAGTGAHMHFCHVQSTSGWQADQIVSMLERAQRWGIRVTTEAYPYGSGSTGVGAAFLAPDQLHRLGIKPSDITFLPTGEDIADEDRLRELRATDPGGTIVMRWLDETDEQQRQVLLRSLLMPDTAIASDAMPLVHGRTLLTDEWPVPEGTLTHPRSLGCYSKVFRWLVRELGVLTLPEAVKRCTLIPARVLEGSFPAMARKGRVQAGADADLVVFDPDTVTDRATGREPWHASTGFEHVLVGGVAVVRDGAPVLGAMPGRAITGVR
jgi:N-acyl-D-aspartate/D-glutamate deacylase